MFRKKIKFGMLLYVYELTWCKFGMMIDITEHYILFLV